ncbi:MAG: hypothetical protein NDI90_11385 [Nitrospira sp. BO4]|jgi:hypothetical protein|nr:hypothetical protein [Nitrospira sp. BO4]
MKLCMCVLATAVFLYSGDSQGGTIVRDFSGDAMQGHDSRMMNSPLQRIPPLLGLSFWPYISYLPAPSLTVVNVQINLPAVGPPSPIPPPSRQARPKFWINRCGTFVEIEVTQATNVMEEEQDTCSHKQ